MIEKDLINSARVVLNMSCVQERHWKAFPKDQSWSLLHHWKSVLELRTIKMQ